MMETIKKTELSLYIDGSKIIFEYYGDINNAKKIVLFCHGFPGSSRLVLLGNNLKNSAISLVEINYRGDKNIGEIGTFSEFRFVTDKGRMSNYTMDLEKEFDSKYLSPVFNEHSFCGIISHYEYDNKEASDSEWFIESEIEESRPSMGGSIYLFYNSEQGLKQLWDFDELKKEMNSENINVLELSEVVQFLESKYKKLDESEEVSEEDDDDSGWCDNCDGEGKIGPFLDEDCDKCNGSGMSDPVYH